MIKQCGNCKWWDRENVDKINNEALAKCLYALPKLPASIDSMEIVYMDFRDGIDCPCFEQIVEDKLIPYDFYPMPTFNKFSDLPMGGMNPPRSVRVGDRDNKIFDYNGTEWVLSPINELIYDKRDLINAIHNSSKDGQ